MINIFPLFLFVCIIIPNAIAAAFTYPISKKTCKRISDFGVAYVAPALFYLLEAYEKFHFWRYNKSKEQLPDQFMVISNHQSMLDIPAYMTFFKGYQTRFVAKEALGRHIPLISEVLRSQDHCLIPRRARPLESIKLMEKFGARAAKENQVPILFPEGTRSKDGNVGKFYSAGFRTLAESAKLPVAVCALDGGHKVRTVKGMGRNFRRNAFRVKVLKVYPCPQTKEECAQLLDEAKELIQNQLNEWRAMPYDEK